MLCCIWNVSVLHGVPYLARVVVCSANISTLVFELKTVSNSKAIMCGAINTVSNSKAAMCWTLKTMCNSKSLCVEH